MKSPITTTPVVYFKTALVSIALFGKTVAHYFQACTKRRNTATASTVGYATASNPKPVRLKTPIDVVAMVFL